MTTLYRGYDPHVCEPPLDNCIYHFNGIEMPGTQIPPLGTVWRCGCGRLWEVIKQPYRNVFPQRRWYRAGLVTKIKYWGK